jgi:hypothetical protein
MDAGNPKKPWWRSKRIYALAALWLAVGVPLTLALLDFAIPQRRVPKGTVGRVEPGMRQAEVLDLLGGRPDWEGVILGRPNGADSLTTNFALDETRLRAAGHRDLLWQQWDGVESTVTVVSDDRGRVVCRYESGGQPRPFGAKLLRLFRKPSAPNLPGWRPSEGFVKGDPSEP